MDSRIGCMTWSGVQYDSRKVQPGDVFVAMRGGTTDGNQYVRQARDLGAAAIVTDSAETFAELKRDAPGLDVRLVKNGRHALAEIASDIYGAPEKKLKISAVTGTNGKTTTAYLLEQMLTSVGRKCVLIGTIETRIAGVAQPSVHTTPEASDLLKIFADGVAAGCTEVVMEASSHALEQGRMWGVPVDVAIFTNLTQDHLDFHGTMEAYAAAKARLFSAEGTGVAPRVAVINLDDENAALMLKMSELCAQTITYSLTNSEADIFASDIVYAAGTTRYVLSTPSGEARIESKLTGRVNVYNQMAAIAAAMSRGMLFDEVVEAVSKATPVPGRFETVANELGVSVVVDYAHTDDALRNLIDIARRFVGSGRVITLFGCGGDRDHAKRPKMGRVAGEDSDFVVVTSDNPRSEDPMAIIDEVLVGLRETNVKYVVEPDRRKAIELAIRAARRGDIVLLAGKGHEKTQTFAQGAVHFDDVEEAERVLRELKNEVGA